MPKLKVSLVLVWKELPFFHHFTNHKGVHEQHIAKLLSRISYLTNEFLCLSGILTEGEIASSSLKFNPCLGMYSPRVTQSYWFIFSMHVLEEWLTEGRFAHKRQFGTAFTNYKCPIAPKILMEAHQSVKAEPRILVGNHFQVCQAPRDKESSRSCPEIPPPKSWKYRYLLNKTGRSQVSSKPCEPYLRLGIPQPLSWYCRVKIGLTLTSWKQVFFCPRSYVLSSATIFATTEYFSGLNCPFVSWKRLALLLVWDKVVSVLVSWFGDWS